MHCPSDFRPADWVQGRPRAHWHLRMTGCHFSGDSSARVVQASPGGLPPPLQSCKVRSTLELAAGPAHRGAWRAGHAGLAGEPPGRCRAVWVHCRGCVPIASGSPSLAAASPAAPRPCSTPSSAPSCPAPGDCHHARQENSQGGGRRAHRAGGAGGPGAPLGGCRRSGVGSRGSGGCRGRARAMRRPQRGHAAVQARPSSRRQRRGGRQAAAAAGAGGQRYVQNGQETRVCGTAAHCRDVTALSAAISGMREALTCG